MRPTRSRLIPIPLQILTHMRHITVNTFNILFPGVVLFLSYLSPPPLCLSDLPYKQLGSVPVIFPLHIGRPQIFPDTTMDGPSQFPILWYLALFRIQNVQSFPLLLGGCIHLSYLYPLHLLGPASQVSRKVLDVPKDPLILFHSPLHLLSSPL